MNATGELLLGPAGPAPETREDLPVMLEREQVYLDAENQPRIHSKALGNDLFASTNL